MSNSVTFVLPQDGSDPRMDECFIERFPCILVQPKKTHLAAHVAREWQACVEWLGSCECDSDQAALIEMLRVAGEHLQGQVANAAMLKPIALREARSAIHGETDCALIYGMLLHLAVANTKPELTQSIRPLAAQLLLAHATLLYLSDGEAIDLCRDAMTSKPPVPSSVPACRLVRQLASNQHAELAQQLPVKRFVFTNAFEQLKSRLTDSAAPYHAPLAALCVTLGDARARRMARRSRISSEPDPANNQSLADEVEAHADEDKAKDRERGPKDSRPSSRKVRSRWTRAKTKVAAGTVDLPTSALSSNEARDYERRGLSAEEVRPERKTLRSSSVQGERPGTSLSARMRSQLGMLKDRARVNQSLPIHPKVIRREELGHLVEELRPWMSKGTTGSPGVAAAEAVAMLALVLATGASPEELHAITITKDETSVPEDHARALVLSVNQDLDLWIRVPAPEMDPGLYAEVSELLQPISEALFLRLPSPLVSLMRTVRTKAGTQSTKTLFSADLDKIKEAATRMLRKVNDRHRTQLRLSRLSSVLPQVIADRTGNWSYAWILSGDGEPQVHTPLVYQTTPESTLRSVYQEALAEIFELPTPKLPPAAIDDSETRHFGSALQAVDHVWGGIATELKNLIPPPPHRGAGKDQYIEHHNAYVLYTLFMALAGTGIRAVRDPIESALDIDWQHGLMFVVDKEAHATGNERFIPLAPTVLDQLRTYRRHLQALAERMVQISPEATATLRAADSGQDPNIPFLFFLQGDLQLQSIRPATLEPRLQTLFPAPLNIGRHHLRSYLTLAGCAGEWIEALMGHEPTGMEALGPYSALSIEDLRWIAEQRVDPMLQEHGWTVVQGTQA